MAAKTKRRRRRRGEGKIAYRVLDSTGAELDVRGVYTFALFRAQRIAELADEPMELRICSDPVFGPPSLLTRIIRDEDGKVWTYIISEED